MRVEQVAPITTVRGGEPVILDQDGDEEPEDDFAAHYGVVEGGDLAGGLAIVVRKAEEENETYGPENESDREGNASQGGAVGDKVRGDDAVEGEVC